MIPVWFGLPLLVVYGGLFLWVQMMWHDYRKARKGR